MNARRGIRKRIWETGSDPSPRDIAEALRDVDEHIQGTIPRKLVELTAQYNPPNPFTVSYDHVPSGVVCIRIRNDKGSSRDVIASGAGQCNFEWSDGIIKIFSVGSFGAAGRYIFTLEIIG